jgi:hypothetical protein
MAEGVLELVVQHRGRDVEKGLHWRPGPTHLLLLLDHALGNDLVDRILDERRGDRLTAPPPGSVVHQRVLVASKVAKKFADVSLNTGVCREFRAGEMARSPKRVSAAVSGLMGVQPRREPGPGIRIIDTEFCGERWIVEAEASGGARCLSPHGAADTEFATDPRRLRRNLNYAQSGRSDRFETAFFYWV